VEQSLTADKVQYYDSICAVAEVAAQKNDHRELHAKVNKLSGRENVTTQQQSGIVMEMQMQKT